MLREARLGRADDALFTQGGRSGWADWDATASDGLKRHVGPGGAGWRGSTSAMSGCTGGRRWCQRGGHGGTGQDDRAGGAPLLVSRDHGGRRGGARGWSERRRTEGGGGSWEFGAADGRDGGVGGGNGGPAGRRRALARAVLGVFAASGAHRVLRRG